MVHCNLSIWRSSKNFYKGFEGDKILILSSVRESGCRPRIVHSLLRSRRVFSKTEYKLGLAFKWPMQKSSIFCNWKLMLLNNFDNFQYCNSKRYPREELPNSRQALGVRVCNSLKIDFWKYVPNYYTDLYKCVSSQSTHYCNCKDRLLFSLACWQLVLITTF